ncbi:MAG: hypothetical protein DRR19_08215 [Candidatus Parabeggiatoa sp. nov. 1]|nr:MAG: hypothetical protein DRR19_08215 [Gammaproteobacteria bacterium]
MQQLIKIMMTSPSKWNKKWLSQSIVCLGGLLLSSVVLAVDAQPQIVPAPLWYSYALLSLLLIFLGIVLYYLYLYAHPLVVNLSANAKELLTLPMSTLPKAYHLLQRTRRLDSVLSKSAVPHKSLEEALQFVNMSPATRAEILATRLGAQVEEMSAGLFALQLPDSFPLNFEHSLLYFPNADLTDAEITAFLRQHATNQKVLIVSVDNTQVAALRSNGENTLWIVPDSRELSELLLSPKPTSVLVRLLVNQLKVTQISPYQTGGGVNKDTIFFGRTQMLAQIMNNEPANYFLLGGQQLGKSSILKRLNRYYRDSSTVICHYIALSNDNLHDRLAAELGLACDSDWTTLLTHLVKLSQRQWRLVLIDDADSFIRAQTASGYPVLHQLRSLSEEEMCHFIFAGFWELSAAMALDYHSLLKNFGESLTVGALEEDACRQLATEPMALMNIRYASPELVEKLLKATGQRANLIAIVCHEMLRNLKPTQRVLAANDLEKALYSDAVRDALVGWGNLSDNDPQATQEKNLDRLIVYATVKAGKFGLKEVRAVLNAHSVSYTTEQLKQSLERLVLGFVIQRHGKSRYVYHIPLLREMILEDDVDALLAQEAGN